MVPHVICNSGGRTSAHMTERLLIAGMKPVIAFANTGWEHPKTLDFVKQCHNRWLELYGVGVTLLEAVVHHGERKPSSHRVMTFDNLSRNCEPYLEVVKKYGIANVAYMHCTRELKENPIISYMESIGGITGHIKDKKGVSANYETFIGIRADEPKRLNGLRDGKQKKVYPLADWAPFRVDKLDVLDFWEGMPFDLGIEEHEGNCLGCFKKSTAKLIAVIETVGKDAFDFAKHIDVEYGFVGDNIIEGVKSELPRTMYRNYTTPDQLIAMSDSGVKKPIKKDAEIIGCGDDCQPFMGGNELEEIAEVQGDMFGDYQDEE
jgi:hypothetical protein